MRALAAIMLSLTVAGCASLQTPSCPTGQERLRTAQMFFSQKPGVSDAEFRKFVDEELTPRFPDGLTILKRWRQEGIATPVLVLTARGTWTDRVDGIDAGADDYLPKPFRMEELMARLRALLRRSTGRAQPSISVGKIILDPSR